MVTSLIVIFWVRSDNSYRFHQIVQIILTFNMVESWMDVRRIAGRPGIYLGLLFETMLGVIVICETMLGASVICEIMLGVILIFSEEAKPILQRLSISPEHWVYLCTNFESRFKGLVGSLHSLEQACQTFKRKRRPNLAASATLFT